MCECVCAVCVYMCVKILQLVLQYRGSQKKRVIRLWGGRAVARSVNARVARAAGRGFERWLAHDSHRGISPISLWLYFDRALHMNWLLWRIGCRS